MTTIAKKVTHKATKIEAGRYEYRGIKIRRDYSIPAGYWGAWTNGLRYNGPSFNTGSLKNIKEDIDKHLDNGGK